MIMIKELHCVSVRSIARTVVTTIGAIVAVLITTPDSEVDNDQNDSNHQENHILHNGTNVAEKGHISRLPGIFIPSSVVVIRSLKKYNSYKKKVIYIRLHLSIHPHVCYGRSTEAI